MSTVMQLCLFLLFAVPITIFDLKEKRIPDIFTFGGILCFALLKLIIQYEPIVKTVLEIGLGFGVFWLIHGLTKGRLGLGDAKFSAFIAVAIGFLPWFVTLLIASASGLAYAVVSITIFRVDRATKIPFAPFLTIGASMAIALKGMYDGIGKGIL